MISTEGDRRKAAERAVRRLSSGAVLECRDSIGRVGHSLPPTGAEAGVVFRCRDVRWYGAGEGSRNIAG